jgi:hypothetical protein
MHIPIMVMLYMRGVYVVQKIVKDICSNKITHLLYMIALQYDTTLQRIVYSILIFFEAFL